MEAKSIAANIEGVNRAFSSQSSHYDADDQANLILAAMRKQVYKVIDRYLPPNSNILEINSGTGIDATYLTARGHTVLATDLSDGMIQQLRKKALANPLLKVEQLNYQELDKLHVTEQFDLLFSNFGGLNCISDLSKVTEKAANILRPGAFVIWVIMPEICPWELAQVFKLRPKSAFRRLKSGGTKSHLEGHYFTTYYHSLDKIRAAFNHNYKFIESESLGLLLPQPHQAWIVKKFPRAFSLLARADEVLRNKYPFNRWGDHIIVTFQYKP